MNKKNLNKNTFMKIKNFNNRETFVYFFIFYLKDWIGIFLHLQIPISGLAV